MVDFVPPTARPCLFLFLDEAVADAADGVEITAGETEFFAKTPHVSVNGAAVDGSVVFPDVAEELFAGKDASTPLGQHRQQFELGCGEADCLVLNADGVARNID